jgi:hypothetical protein
MALVFNFSQAISDPSIQFGDFDADDDTEVMTAFSGLNGTGSNVGSNSVFYPASEDISNGDSDVATLAQLRRFDRPFRNFRRASH